MVTGVDVMTSNGIIHVIDKVLMPTDTPNDIPERLNAQAATTHWLPPSSRPNSLKR